LINLLFILGFPVLLWAQMPPPFAPWPTIRFIPPPGAGAKCISAAYPGKAGKILADGDLTMSSTTVDGDRKSYIMHFSELARGEIVPAEGALYKVTSIGSGKGPFMTWTLLPNKEWPRGVETQPQPILILLDRAARSTHTERDRWTLILREINVPRDGKGKPSAVLRFRKTNPELVLEEATVRQGDILLIDGRGHRVRYIVPRDEKTGVFGWLELDPESVPEADLKRGKTPYVKPMSLLK
jgi:hypothetical protein